MRDTLQ